MLLERFGRAVRPPTKIPSERILIVNLRLSICVYLKAALNFLEKHQKPCRELPLDFVFGLRLKQALRVIFLRCAAELELGAEGFLVFFALAHLQRKTAVSRVVSKLSGGQIHYPLARFRICKNADGVNHHAAKAARTIHVFRF